MTKEELYEKAFNFGRKHSCESDVLEGYLDEFFEQNVVIPKGKNRHPDADLFHRAIEDPNLRLETDRWAMTWKEDECIFYKSGVIDKKALIRYRIKPLEPVYEWQWLIQCTIDDVPNKLSSYMTDEEHDEMRKKGDHCFITTKLEETKRERQ